MLKLLLTVRCRQEGAKMDDIARPLLWPVKPAVGEEFWVSKTTDLNYPVTKVTHYPYSGTACIEVFFDCADESEMRALLDEEDGGWVSTNILNFYGSLVWTLP